MPNVAGPCRGTDLARDPAAERRRGTDQRARARDCGASTWELLEKSRSCVGEMFLEDGHSEYIHVGEAHGRLGEEAELKSWTESLEDPLVKAAALIGLTNGILDRQKAK